MTIVARVFLGSIAIVFFCIFCLPKTHDAFFLGEPPSEANAVGSSCFRLVRIFSMESSFQVSTMSQKLIGELCYGEGMRNISLFAGENREIYNWVRYAEHITTNMRWITQFAPDSSSGNKSVAIANICQKTLNGERIAFCIPDRKVVDSKYQVWSMVYVKGSSSQIGLSFQNIGLLTYDSGLFPSYKSTCTCSKCLNSSYHDQIDVEVGHLALNHPGRAIAYSFALIAFAGIKFFLSDKYIWDRGLFLAILWAVVSFFVVIVG